MSIRVKALAAAAVVSVGMASFGASAAPVAGALALKNATPTNVETVRWGGGWGGGWRGGGWGWRGRGWGWGVGAGLVTGAIIGGALASPYYYGYPYPYPYPYYGGYYPAPYYPAPVYYGPPVYAAPPPGGGAVAYCAQRYRSYDPRSGTYLGNDGLRHPCP